MARENGFAIIKNIKGRQYVWNEDFGFCKPEDHLAFMFTTKKEALETIKLRNLENKVTLNNSEFNDIKIVNYGRN